MAKAPEAPAGLSGTDALKWILILWGVACIAILAYYVVRAWLFGDSINEDASEADSLGEAGELVSLDMNDADEA